ncbi:HIT family protein [Streptomyces dysideae]|uniref:HIT family hydrolase n=1 Tax=Streptomyces dysideae TaxID=909626 RepID=A0A117S055_9ACTN|nr:HIT domain-containing protein [Streptomyces dysideae]KUO18887.1 HIT family hydrolase [Streptomyces dysideae]
MDDAACAFCGIVADPSRARVVYADAHTLAFFPLAPATRGHTLVVPRTHSADLWAMDETGVQKLTRAVLVVGRALRAALEPEGLNVVNSAGAVASQTVFHTHVHLVPRWPGDAMGPIWPPKGKGFPDDDAAVLDELAHRVTEMTGPQNHA